MAAGSDTSGTKEVNFADCDEIKPATDSTEGEYIFKLDTNPEQGSGLKAKRSFTGTHAIRIRNPSVQRVRNVMAS